MSTLQTAQWKEEFAANLSLESWNRNILPLMHSLGDEYKRAAHAVARGRNWTYSGIVEEYVQAWTMKPCQGKNLLSVGYQDGILRIGFHGKNQLPLFMVWREIWEAGEVVFAYEIFRIDWPWRSRL